MARLSINLLGSFRVTLGGEPATAFESDKVRALLAYLAVEGDRPHRRESLVGLLWPEWPEPSARQNLSQTLYRLRRTIGDQEAEPPFLLTSSKTIQFNRDSDAWLDTAAFSDLTAECQRHDHPRSEACDACMGRLEEAVRLYQGDFLKGFSLPDSASFEEWLQITREGLHRQALEAYHSLSACYEAHGDMEKALGQARRAVELDPSWEEGQRSLMRLLALTGQTSAALAQYERLRQILEEELGVAPSEETRELRQLLLQGQRPPPIPSAAAIPERKPRPVGACPYRGLAAFRQKDAPFFYGRDEFTDRLTKAVKARSMVAVIVGSSGSGKSSAVFAGLLPRLQEAEREPWLVVTFRPGDQPFLSAASALVPLLEPELGEVDRLVESTKLADALGQGDVSLIQVVDRVLKKGPRAGRLLLVMDQFEELYTLCPEREVQHRFLDTLLAAVAAAVQRRRSPLVLLLTLRADFMGQALTHRPFADALQEAALIMGPMTRDELRATIVKPAEMQGAAFEEGLVERILDDVGQDPGHLPLLEFALTLLWEAHDYGWLTHAGYEEIGRVEGALARYADQVFNELGEEERERARQVFIQLVRPGEGTEDTRRVATRAELGDNWGLVQHLADRRLVVTGRDQATGRETAEVVHEALIQRWGQMRAWMDRDRAFRTWQERLRAALRGWEASERDEGALSRGAPLLEAENWMADRGAELSGAEQDYIRAGVALRERRAAERERTRRRTILALAGGVVLATTLAVLALVARLQAITEREEAQRQASIGLAARAIAELEGTSPDRAVLLALWALEHYPYTSQAESALARIVQEYTPSIDLGVFRPTWSPDGRRLAVFPPAGYGTVNVTILDADTGDQLQSITASTNPQCELYDMIWSPTGDRLALTAFVRGDEDVECPTVTVWDLEAGALLLSLPAEVGYWVNVAWSPDGSALFTGGDDGLLRVWKLETGVEQLASPAHTNRIERIVSSPAGDLLATASADGTAKVWDVATLLALSQDKERDADAESSAKLFTLTGHIGGVTSITWSPGGDRLATASQDGTTRVWLFPEEDQGISQALLTLFGHSGTVLSVAWSADGRHIGTLGEDGTVRAWDAVTGMELFREPCGSIVFIPLPKVTWSPAGELVFIGYEESLAWDVSQRALQLVGHTDAVWGARWSPDGARIATSSFDGTARIWDGTTGEELLAVEELGQFSFVAWSPDGTRIATASFFGPAQVWDAATGELLVEVSRPPGYSNASVSWSLDGSRIAASSFPGNVMQVFDAATGEILATTEEGDCILLDPSWSPLGDHIATGCIYPNEGAYPDGNTPARVWNASTGEKLLTLESDDGWTMKAIWSPDGKRIATPYGGFGEHEGDGWTVTVWQISSDPAGGALTAEELLTYAGHTSGVNPLRWSPNGKRIASGDEDGMVKVWDATTGDEVYSFQAPDYLLNLDWTPDGAYLVATGWFNTPLVLRVWPSTEELIEHAYDCCVTRELTPEERMQNGLPPAQ